MGTEMEIYQCWAYLVDQDRLTEYDEAINCSFWEKHPEIHEKFANINKYEFLGEGYITNHDIYGKLCGGDTLCRFYKRVNNGKQKGIMISDMNKSGIIPPVWNQICYTLATFAFFPFMLGIWVSGK